jgi:hypothetical protein
MKQYDTCNFSTVYTTNLNNKTLSKTCKQESYCLRGVRVFAKRLQRGASSVYVENCPALYAATNASVSKHCVYKLGILHVDLYEDLDKTPYIELHPIRCPVQKVHPDPVLGSKDSHRPDAWRRS